jgi:hypothetical protein
VAKGLGRDAPVSLQEMLDYGLAQREAMGDRLRELAERYAAQDPGLAGLLRKVASDAGPTIKELRRARSHEPDSVDEVMGHVRGIVGQLGELKVAVRLNGLAARGLDIQDLGRFMGHGAVGDSARARLARLGATHPRELGKELDLITGEGWVWNEVKNYAEPFSPRHNAFDSVIQQAELTLRIRSLLMKDPVIGRAIREQSGSIRLRIHFVGGVTDDGARALEALGFEVVGPRVGGAGGAGLRDAA